MVTTSHVNGQGLWRSWQRSFRRPLDALLDLMDNAIDANHGHGKIRISSCTAETDGNDGLLLLNSYSKKAYKEMQQVLEVFSSQKEREAIGENGVGVKQASANLANLAIVVTRKGKRFQVGVLCASLQRQEGIHIPSFTLAGNCLEEELEDLCDDATFRKCMEYLGGIPSDAGKRTPTRRNSTALCHAGRDRLLRLMKDMSDPKEWPEKDCVFGLLLDQMRLDQTIESLLNELESTLPSTYLHLHAYRCDITINKNPLKFQYWERRLAELTCFPIKVSRSVDVQKVETDQMSDPKENSNKIRIFVGFDPQRSKDDNQQSCTSLYIYSRECGRLVKHVPDARNEIGLTASGTLFCQGLTVIVDDFESSLPLTPTKQDIAWSDGPKGDIHRQNVYAWIRAVTYLYYHHHLADYGSKGELNEEVRRHCLEAKALEKSRDHVTPLEEHMLFNTFHGCEWKRHHTGVIIVKNKSKYSVVHGTGTLLPFANMGQNQRPKPAKKKRKSKSDDTDEEEDPPSRRKRKSSSKKNSKCSPDEVTSQSSEQERRSSRLSKSVSVELNREVSQLKELVRERNEEASSLRMKTETTEKALEEALTQLEQVKSSSCTEAVDDSGKVKALQCQLAEKDSIIAELERKLEHERQSKLNERKQDFSKELKALERKAAACLDRLERRNQQLESENRGMKEEIDEKNEKLLIMEEELMAVN